MPSQRYLILTLLLLICPVSQAQDRCNCTQDAMTIQPVSPLLQWQQRHLSDQTYPGAVRRQMPRLALQTPTTGTPGRSGFAWSVAAPERDWQYIVVHHSATSSGSVESIHREHRQRKDRSGNNWLGIGYHFVIGNGAGMEDGEICPTFRWKGQIHGAHSGSTIHNASGIGVCLIGNFNDHPPSERQLTAVNQLLSQLSKRYQISPSHVIGHRSIKATACPGNLFPLKAILQQLEESS